MDEQRDNHYGVGKYTKISKNIITNMKLVYHSLFKPRLYALSLPLGVYLPLGVNICPSL